MDQSHFLLCFQWLRHQKFLIPLFSGFLEESFAYRYVKTAPFKI